MFNCSLLHANLYTNLPFGNHFPNQIESCLFTIGELTDIKGQFRSSISALDFFSQSRRSNYYWKNYSDGFRFPTQSSYSWPNLGLEWSICSKSRVVSSCLPGMMDIHSSIHKYFSRCHNSDIFPIFRLSWNQLLAYRQIHFIKLIPCVGEQ